MLAATIKQNDPNRILLTLGTLIGPLSSPTLGPLDPQRDLEVYIGGVRVAVNASSYSAGANQYALYTIRSFNPTDIVQVIHHLPAQPFAGANGLLPGLALVALLVDNADLVFPVVGLNAVPGSDIFSPISLVWSASSVAYFDITTTNGLDTGFLSAAAGSGVIYLTPPDVPGTYLATMLAYDGSGEAIDALGAVCSVSGKPQLGVTASFVLSAP